MTRTGVLLAAVSLSLLFFAPSILRADPITHGPLPGAVASGSLTVPLSGQSSIFSGFGDQEIDYSVSLGPPYGALQSFTNAQAFISGGQDPAVFANLDVGNFTSSEILSGDLNDLGAQSDLVYSFVVNGPDSTSVPIDISAAGGASLVSPSNLEGADWASADFNIASPESVLIDEEACAGLSACVGYSQPSFYIADQTFDVEANEIYTVSISAETVLAGAALPDTPGLQGLSANAFVDPTIVLDPSVGSEYSLSLSSNLAPTPEPNYLPIMPPCLAGLLLYINRSKASSTAVQPA